jgi:tetratricopeptide (TPR) repeat protein
MSSTPAIHQLAIPAASAAFFAAAADSNSSTRLLYLGGGSVNRLPRNSVYASDLLPRPLSLPPPHSKDLEFHGENKKVAKDFFIAIHDEPMMVEIKYPCDQQRYLTMSFRTSDSNTFPSCLKLIFNLRGDACYENVSAWTSLYSLRQMNSLVCRCVHRFLRLYGVNYTPRIRAELKEIVARRYIDNHWWVENLDLTICWVDAEFNDNKASNMAWLVVKVGEALEAAGRFLDAAHIYDFLVELLKNKQITNDQVATVNESMALSCCGLSYKRGGDMSNAERYYVRSLHAHPNVLDFVNDAQLKSNYFNIENLYRTNPDLEDSLNTDPRMSGAVAAVLIGLLFWSGYKEPGKSQMPFPIGMQAVARLNPTLVYNKESALKALRECARAAKDVASWRAKLVSFVNPNIVGPLKLNGFYSPGDASTKSQNKMMARNALPTLHNKYHCSACGTIKKYADFKQCPCHTALYCNEVCQVAHWKKEHKRSCPGRKKMSNANNGGGGHGDTKPAAAAAST